MGYEITGLEMINRKRVLTRPLEKGDGAAILFCLHIITDQRLARFVQIPLLSVVWLRCSMTLASTGNQYCTFNPFCVVEYVVEFLLNKRHKTNIRSLYCIIPVLQVQNCAGEIFRPRRSVVLEPIVEIPYPSIHFHLT